MSDLGTLGWLGLFGLGALHGINPGMGWLFAVALGLQERRARAVWRALPPLAVGHAAAVGAVVAVAVAIGLAVPAGVLKWIVVILLATLGGYRLVRHAHPRYGGMRVNGRQLAVWSFLMATAHGAGVMVLPFLLAGSAGGAGSAGVGGVAAGHAGHAMLGTAPQAGGAAGGGGAALVAGFGAEQVAGMMAAVAHTAGYLVVTGLLAVVVYQRLGLGLLRKAWINLDLIWAVALLGTALGTALL